jgi:hypothetical protein
MGLPGRHLLLDNPDLLWKGEHELRGLLHLLIGLRLSEEDSRRLCLVRRFDRVRKELKSA